jgi:deazaflavin-dependent oxidoreductase (nitroreductase family)
MNPASTPINSATSRYIAPDAFTRRVFNPLISQLTRLGLSVRGSRVLEVRGRTSGEWRAVPVNPLRHGNDRFLVAPRGETQWVRNIRVAGGGRLRKGRRIEEFRIVEVANEDKDPILRAYLDEWGFEVGKFFEGVTKNSTDAELAAIAPGFPVLRIVPA